MAKAKLSPNEVLRIIRLLDAWDGSLTWEGLVAALPQAVGRPFTSQTLRRHASIAAAFARAKSRCQMIRILTKTSLKPGSKRLLPGLAGTGEAEHAPAASWPKKPALGRPAR